MKRRILFAALVSLLLITSCNVNKTDDTAHQISFRIFYDIDKLEQIDNTASKRQGYFFYEGDLYGDVDSVTITKYSLTDKFGEVVKDKETRKSVYKFNLRGDVVEYNEYLVGLFFLKDLYKFFVDKLVIL